MARSMTPARTYDVAVVGAGVIGCAVARALASRCRGRIIVAEKEAGIAFHTSGRNSGVIHSGFNPKPGTLKAKLCVLGSRMLRQYCRRTAVPMNQVGTVVLAQNDSEIRTLHELQRRAKLNGVQGVRIIDKNDLKKLEPHARAVEALVSPTGAIVDSQALVRRLWRDCLRKGGRFLFNWKLRQIREKSGVLRIKSASGKIIVARFLINCAGLYADSLAHQLGVGLDYRIVPFRGDYFRLTRDRSYLVNSMVYPTPDLNFPFLGIHLTRTVHGDVIVGPNASLALGREAYSGRAANPIELLQTVVSSQFLRLLSKPEFLRMAGREMWISMVRSRFAAGAQALVPEIRPEYLERGMSGIRAQLVDSKGNLVDDFVSASTEMSFHVLNAVSPGLTCSLAFADMIVKQLFDKGYLN